MTERTKTRRPCVLRKSGDVCRVPFDGGRWRNRLRPPPLGRASALVGLAAGALFFGLAGIQAAEPIPRAEHGAASMEYQLRDFDRLVPAADVREVPAGLDPVVWEAFIPIDNEMTPQRVALGKKLFFDTRLSKDGTVSCATCHDVTRAFTDQRPTSEGIGGQLGRRNAPTTMNTALLQTLFLDGRSPTLDHQARLPIINPIEMGSPDGESAVKAIADDPEYKRLFQEAYGRPVNYEDIGRALGAFERTMVFLDSPFRRYLDGDEGAISAEAKEGWRLFNEEARCVSCHHVNLSNPLGTDTDHPLAIEVLRDIADEERVHAGEFLRLLHELAPDEEKLYAEGAEEVDEEIKEMKGK